jgi:predicted ATP-grasp superfamily ATP-dependent carboligase
MANDLLILEKGIINPERPTFMVAGFHEWANAGNVSSGIPEYLIGKLPAKKVGHIRKGDFYLFQLPGSHFMFRPPVKYVDGFEEDYHAEPVNDFYYAEVGGKGIIVFIGTEPNQREDSYINALLDAAQEFGVRRIILPAGVGGEVPFDKERLVSCTYSLKSMQPELRDYGVSFSNYDRNATIGMVINHYCKEKGIESVRFSARTPSYELSLTLTSDKRAMYDIMRRVRYMLGISLDLSDLEKESKQQLADFESALKRLCAENPDLEPQVTTYMEQIRQGFEELRFEEPIKIPEVFLKEFNQPPDSPS